MPAWNDIIEAMWTIRPPSPWDTMRRAAARETTKAPTRFTSRTRRSSSTGSSSAGARKIVPALQTQTSTRPRAPAASSSARSASSARSRSHRTHSPAPSLRWSVATCAPSSSSRRAIAAPMPRLAPVTTAAFPARGLPFDVEPPAVGSEDEVVVAIADVVERHRRERLEERHAALRAQLVLDAPVHHARVAGSERLRLVPDGDLDLAVDDHHGLLGVLVGVAAHGRPGLVGDLTEQHLLAADCVERHAGEDAERVAARPAAEGRDPLRVSHRRAGIPRRPRPCPRSRK